MARLLIGGDGSIKSGLSRGIEGLSPKSWSRGLESPKKSWWTARSLSTVSSTASGDTSDPADSKDAELICPVGIDGYCLLLSRSHESFDGIGSKITPYLKLSGDYTCIKTAVTKAQQTSSGNSLEAVACYQPESRPRILLHDEDACCVVVEAYLKHTMRKDTLLGRGNLSGGVIFDRIAGDYDGRCSVSVEMFSATNDFFENCQGLQKELVGEVRFVFVQEDSCSREASSWAAAKVRRWNLECKLPRPPSISHCFRGVDTLVLSPAPQLFEELLRNFHEIALEEVAQLSQMGTDGHLQEVRRFTSDVMKLANEIRKVPGFTTDADLKLHTTCEQLASCLFEVAVQSPDHRDMKAALVGATILGCKDTLTFTDGESDFRAALRIPEHVRLEEFLDDHVDGEYRQPADGGLLLVEDQPSPPKVDETVRYKIRDEVAQRVLVMLSCPAQLQPVKGFTYQVIASKHIMSSDFKMPFLTAELMRHVVLFVGEPDVSGLNEVELADFQRCRYMNSMTALLARFDLVAQPVFAEFGADFRPVASSPVATTTGCLPLSGSAGGARQKQRCDSSDSIVGGPGWFWVMHGAAINVGESANAEDFPQYSMPAPVDESPRRARLANGQTARRVLDEDKYVHDMGELWRCAFEASAQLDAEDIVVFPWGMGAFLRNLHLLDSIYGNAVKMRHLKSRLADGLFKAAAGTSVVTRIHVCLMDNSYESRVNYNVMVERGIANAKQHPELATRVRFYRNVDSLGLASRLSNNQGLMMTHRRDEVRRVVLLNGANRKLLGNHWFGNGARTAIDENLHRRCTAMSVGSLLLNGGAAVRPRMPCELAQTVGSFGGRILKTSPEPYREGGASMCRNTATIGGKSDYAASHTLVVNVAQQTHQEAGRGLVGCTSGDAKVGNCEVSNCDFVHACINGDSKVSSGLCSGICVCCTDSPDPPPMSYLPSLLKNEVCRAAPHVHRPLQLLLPLSPRRIALSVNGTDAAAIERCIVSSPAPGARGRLGTVSNTEQPSLERDLSLEAATLPLPPTDAAHHVAHLGDGALAS
eukprot:TRINITY_DN35506_c1_g1_i1.p1 TRINITY_DN35506_c1_g1~~TRINITY_DN35506_c1_g1_i1.p1  ORF type:complete len:1043 (-),score=173.57 TRINITY_DN35506_c1_g1_i1:240-3368(-)